jgi:RNA polymerase sigma factor (TIGR02999 family)
MSSGPDRVEGKTTADVTRLLNDAAAGNSAATNALFQAVYDQLRQIARQRMAEERVGHTLQATALVHETYLRLVGDQQIHWRTRAHFFSAAAEAMRRILIDYARKRGRLKRGGGLRRVPANLAELAGTENVHEIVAVDDAIRRLEREDARAGQIVRLRFFAGLSVEEAAGALGLSPRTAAREWSYARAWLFDALRDVLSDGTQRECRHEES